MANYCKFKNKMRSAGRLVVLDKLPGFYTERKGEQKQT